MASREVFPNAPLVLVAFEIRYPPTERLGQPASLERLKELVEERLPLRGDLYMQEMVIHAHPQGPPAWSVQTVPRFTTRDRTTALQVGIGSLIVETTIYDGFDGYRDLIELGARSVSDVARPDGVARIGLRYIDEIRVPGMEAAPGDWSGYIADNLLAPVEPKFVEGADLTLRTWQGAVQYGTGRDRSLVLRYGPAEGYAVPEDGKIRRREAPPPGLFFLLDFDSYWEPTDEVPAFAPELILKAADELHRPARALFDAVVTERLRDDVFRRPREEARSR
jgi:uncharacterized protein (TIGR04255 family)